MCPHAGFHVFGSSPHGLLAYLEAHLRGLIVDDAAEVEVGRELAASSIARLLLAAVGRSAVLAVLGLRRGWRAHHGDRRNMLGNWVVERRGVRWRRVVAGPLHDGVYVKAASDSRDRGGRYAGMRQLQYSNVSRKKKSILMMQHVSAPYFQARHDAKFLPRRRLLNSTKPCKVSILF